MDGPVVLLLACCALRMLGLGWTVWSTARAHRKQQIGASLVQVHTCVMARVSALIHMAATPAPVGQGVEDTQHLVLFLYFTAAAAVASGVVQEIARQAADGRLATAAW